MPTYTTRLNATKPASSENVDISILDNNFDLFDAAVGATVGTSASMPASAFSGRIYYQTNTGLLKINTAANASAAATWADASGNYESRVAALERPPVNVQTGTTYTAVTGDNGKVVAMNNASSNTITFPTMTAGSTVGILQLGAGATNIAGSGVTISSRGGLTRIAGQYGFATLWFYTSTQAILFGDLV